MDIADYKLLVDGPWECVVSSAEFKDLVPVDGMLIGVKKQVVGSINYHWHKYMGVMCANCRRCYWSRVSTISKARFTGCCSRCKAALLKDAGNPNNPMYNTHYSDEAKKRLRHIYKSIPNIAMDRIVLDPTTKKFINTGDLSDFALQLSSCMKGSNNPMYGKQSAMMRARYQDPEFIERYRRGVAAKPNKVELQLQDILNRYFPNTYKYVGDFQVNIGGRFPDFINVNGRKEVIELFGNYWHTLEEVKPTIDHYKQHGFSCIVIWDEELIDELQVVNHVNTTKPYIPEYGGRTINDYKKVGKSDIILDSITKKFGYKEIYNG